MIEGLNPEEHEFLKVIGATGYVPTFEEDYRILAECSEQKIQDAIRRQHIKIIIVVGIIFFIILLILR